MMHSNNIRRLPVERARHKKRLAREDNPLPRDLVTVIGGITFTGPFTITRTFPVDPDTTTTPSTSLLTSASQISSSSNIAPVLPPDTTPPAAPAPPAQSTPPVLTPASPSQPVASAIASPPGTNSAADNKGGAVSGVSTQHALPTGAIVGITIACVILLLGALLFFIRQRAIRNRRQRQSTWQPARPMMGGPPAGMVQTSMSPGASFAQIQAQSLVGTAAMPTPPASSYNNPIPPPMPISASAAAVVASSSAVVVYEFIPTLPDELSINTGEVVRVVSEFDDGWALCANTRGEQGMVPLECLNRGSGGGGSAAALAVTNRDSRRTSSLAGRI